MKQIQIMGAVAINYINNLLILWGGGGGGGGQKVFKVANASPLD